MFLKTSASYQKKIYLSFVQGYRDKNGKSKHKTIEKIGYLEDLKKLYDDPIAHFKEVAKLRNNEEINELVVKNLNSHKIEENSKPKNLGYVTLKKVYEELGIIDIFDKCQKSSKIKYNVDDVISMLVFMRILKPGSKKATFENKDILFENFDFSLDDMYRCLTIVNPLKEKIEQTIWENTKEKYLRDTSCSFYDCTNYYFEVEYNDDDTYQLDKDGNAVLDEKGNPIIVDKGLRKRGPEKNHRPDPIVEMGLLMDKTGIPLSFDLFPGNESEKLSLLPIFKRTRKDFDLKRTIVVADRGLNTSDNIIKIAGTSIEQAQKLNGYVYGQSVRGADEEFKKWVLNGNYITSIIKDDQDTGEEKVFVHKSRIYPKTLRVLREDKGKTKSGNDKYQDILVDQKQMVYYSQKYADKQKRDREQVISKARDLITHPDKYRKSTTYGIAGYVNNLAFIKGTGEIANASSLQLNEDKIREEEKYDGYYSIVTSEEKLSDMEIRNIYRGLNKIEETFKVTKSGLAGRPVWVSTKDHIESHFLTCFISLVIVRLLEQRLNNKYSFKRIIESIRNYNSVNLEHDMYVQTYRNEIIDQLGNSFSIDFGKKYRSLSEIRKIFKS